MMFCLDILTERNDSSPRVLLIYMGGTLGMVAQKGHTLSPTSTRFMQWLDKLPYLLECSFTLHLAEIRDPLDSSEMTPTHWQQLGRLIRDHYDTYHAFVVLHGTDTMAYTASALSYMLGGLDKPVVFTGAQRPLQAASSDAHKNIQYALQVAIAARKQKPMLCEVCILFGTQLLRGNRASKRSTRSLQAFHSPKYPPLAEYKQSNMVYRDAHLYTPSSSFHYRDCFERNIAVLRLFPGISRPVCEYLLGTPSLRGVVLLTYGAGNPSGEAWLFHLIQQKIKQGIIFLNISECIDGLVCQDLYRTGRMLGNLGVISGEDMTFEAGITKFMFLLGEGITPFKEKMKLSLAGECSS